MLYERYPFLRERTRPIFRGLRQGHLRPHSWIDIRERPAVIVYEDIVCGASEEGYEQALALAKKVAADVRKPAQLRLFLRNEPGLVARLLKHDHDTVRCSQILI